MAFQGLNKTALAAVRKRLALYRKVLPSLEIKRQQLAEAVAAARVEVGGLAAGRVAALERAARRVPMAGNAEIDLTGLVQVTRVSIAEQRRYGVALPFVVAVVCERASYGYLAKPHWVDVVARDVQQIAELSVAEDVARRRLARLEAALTRTVQRVHLFEKVLVPEAQAELRRILVFLGDAERAALVRAKLAKARHALEPTA
jgi:V/A-type H+-transporting ATPase subunit D